MPVIRKCGEPFNRKTTLVVNDRGIGGRDFRQQPRGLREMRGAPRHGRRGGGPAFPHGGQHAGPQPRTIESRRVIHWILEPLEPAAFRIVRERRAVEIEQWTRVKSRSEARARRHCGEAGHARTPQQLDEDGLELVVPMMRGEQKLARSQVAAECAITRLPRRGLDAGTRRRRESECQDLERHAGRAAARATARRPGGRFRLEAVIDVDRAQRKSAGAREFRHDIEQHGGIEPAGVRDAVFRRDPGGFDGRERRTEALRAELHLRSRRRPRSRAGASADPRAAASAAGPQATRDGA